MAISKFNSYLHNRANIKMLPMWSRISAFTGIAISILLIAVSIFCTPNFVESHVSSDGIITESGTLLLINVYRLTAAITGILLLIVVIIRPDFLYSFTIMFAQRSLKERTIQITQRADNFSYKVLSLLICIVIIGAFLRFYGIDNQSLWHDEVASSVYSNKENLSDVINESVRKRDVHPLGYHVLLYYIEKYVGNSESALRFPSAISGILSILVIFLLGVQLYSYKEGLISSILTAFLWCPVYYSQEARVYSLLLLFSLLSTYFWILLIRAIDKELKSSYYTMVGYVIFSIISCYLHYFGLYLIALQGLAASLWFILKREKLIKILLLYVIVMLFYVPFLPIFWEHLHKTAGHIPKPTTFAFIKYLWFLFNNSAVLLSIVLILFIFLIYFNLITFIKLRKDKAERALIISSDLLLLLWLVVPFAGIFIKSILSDSIYTDRNLIISLPAAYLLLSRSITQFHFNFKKISLLGLIISCLLLFHLIYVMNYYSEPHKEQFREAANYIVEKDQVYRDALIVSWPGKSFYEYYFQRMDYERNVDIVGGRQEDIAPVSNKIRQKCPKYVWFVEGHTVPDIEFANFLKKELELVDQKHFFRAKVWLFKNNDFCEFSQTNMGGREKFKTGLSGE